MAAKFLDHNNRDDDGDGKKVIGLYKQNNNFARARARARVLYISKPSMHDCDTILSNFTHPLYEVHEHDKKNLVFFFST